VAVGTDIMSNGSSFVAPKNSTLFFLDVGDNLEPLIP
jgi:hypothetical protein